MKPFNESLDITPAKERIFGPPESSMYFSIAWKKAISRWNAPKLIKIRSYTGDSSLCNFIIIFATARSAVTLIVFLFDSSASVRVLFIVSATTVKEVGEALICGRYQTPCFCSFSTWAEYCEFQPTHIGVLSLNLRTIIHKISFISAIWWDAGMTFRIGSLLLSKCMTKNFGFFRYGSRWIPRGSKVLRRLKPIVLLTWSGSGESLSKSTSLLLDFAQLMTSSMSW